MMIEMFVERLMQADTLKKDLPLDVQVAESLGGKVSKLAQDGLNDAALLVRFGSSDGGFSDARVTSDAAVSDGREMVRVVLTPTSNDATLESVSADPEAWRRGPRTARAPGYPMTRFWDDGVEGGLSVACATRVPGPDDDTIVAPLICTVSWR